MLWFVASISIVFCLFAVSFLFSKALVEVNPKTRDVTLDEDLSATKESNSENLSFDLVVIDGEESKSIEATGEKDVSEKATGIVVLYNAFSTSSQALNIDTRLEGSNGKIYKTQNKITVPGMVKDGTPGSIEVGIYGGEAGEDYNSAPLDFKILGFKGTPKYSKFYGRSKGEITGGFKGKAPAISDTEKTNTVTDLKINLQAKLLKKVTDQIPSGFILFRDAIFLNVKDSDISFVTKDKNLTITAKGTLYGLLFDEQKLTKEIIDNSVGKETEDDVYVSNIKDLTFSLVDKNNISFTDVKNIDFNLSGSAKIVWKLDIDKFTKGLLGVSKGDFNKVLIQYPNIESATLELGPMWSMSVPDQIEKIKININYPK